MQGWSTTVRVCQRDGFRTGMRLFELKINTSPLFLLKNVYTNLYREFFINILRDTMVNTFDIYCL